MAKISGILVIPLVKTIRADKSGKFNKYFTETELATINQKFYPISWMNFELYQKIANAVAQENANNDEKTLRNWGYVGAGRDLGPYKPIFIVEGSLKKTVQEYLVTSRAFFDFGQFEAPIIEDGYGQIRVHGFPKDFEVFYHFIRGWFAKVFEIAGANKVKSDYLAKTWEGDHDTIIEYRWS